MREFTNFGKYTINIQNQYFSICNNNVEAYTGKFCTIIATYYES